LLTDLTPIYLQRYLLARPVSAERLLPVMAALPNHMASLLLTSSAVTNTICDAPSEDLAVIRLRAQLTLRSIGPRACCCSLRGYAQDLEI
jgi:hypothetical protein